MKWIYKTLPWFFVALFAAEIVAVMMPKGEGEFHIREFGRLPVLLNGRIQPFDSVGLNALRQIRGTGDLPLEQKKMWEFWKHPKKLKPSEWILEVMLRPEQANQRPVFLIHHPELLSELKLQDKGLAGKSALRYYTYNELKPVRDEVHTQAVRIQETVKEEKQRTHLQKQTVKLENALLIYERLKNSLRPQTSDDFAAELADFQKLAGPGMAAFNAQQEKKAFDQDALERFAEPLNHYFVMSKWALPLIVPPSNPEKSPDQWVNAGTGLLESLKGGEIPPAMAWFAKMATAYRHNHAAEFNRAIAEYKQWLGQKFQRELSKARREFFFNDTKAFLHALIMYIFAFVLAIVSLLTFGVTSNLSEALRRSSFWVVILAGVIHTAALVFRMVLEGRPPVTNLYSSAIFIGWGAMVLGVILERIFRAGIGNAVASLAGFVTLIIAHNLALGGDTMEMMRAVLDTNFWLATHVVVMVLGYASTFVAGLLAIFFILLGVFTPILSRKLGARGAATASAAVGIVAGPATGIKMAKQLPSAAGTTDLSRALAKMVYGIICFATLFSFTGTVLGGIWADQSWGRFWGWDPKENGALIIVLWNALILHAKWGGLVRERGLINLAVFGNVVTSFSWFGVNMLGIGLHSYGFMDAAFKWLMLFVSSQLLIISVGLLPKNLWRSFRNVPQVA